MTDEQPADHLREAFAREAQAALRSLYFARRADVEGRAEAAALLRTMVEGQYAHAFGHLEFLEDSGDPLAAGADTAANLERLAAEADSNAAAYKEYSAAATSASHRDLADWFETVAAAKRAHAEQLRGASPPRRPR